MSTSTRPVGKVTLFFRGRQMRRPQAETDWGTQALTATGAKSLAKLCRKK